MLRQRHKSPVLHRGSGTSKITITPGPSAGVLYIEINLPPAASALGRNELTLVLAHRAMSRLSFAWRILRTTGRADEGRHGFLLWLHGPIRISPTQVG